VSFKSRLARPEGVPQSVRNVDEKILTGVVESGSLCQQGREGGGGNVSLARRRRDKD